MMFNPIVTAPTSMHTPMSVVRSGQGALQERGKDDSAHNGGRANGGSGQGRAAGSLSCKDDTASGMRNGGGGGGERDLKALEGLGEMEKFTHGPGEEGYEEPL